jgi:hypothetical protein
MLHELGTLAARRQRSAYHRGAQRVKSESGTASAPLAAMPAPQTSSGLVAAAVGTCRCTA